MRGKLLIGLVVLVAWCALGLQLFIMIDNTPGNGLTPAKAVGRFLIYFTILSNLLVAVSLSVIITSPSSFMGRFFRLPSSLAAIALYIFIVGLVYNLILRSLWKPEGAQRTADELLHVAVPLLYLFYWSVYAPKQTLKWVDAFWWLFFPGIYLVYALTRGALEGFYPYFFIDVKEYGYGKVLLNSLGLLLIFVAAGLLLVLIAKRIPETKTLNDKQ